VAAPDAGHWALLSFRCATGADDCVRIQLRDADGAAVGAIDCINHGLFEAAGVYALGVTDEYSGRWEWDAERVN
jgi:hypothetical protein